MNTKTKQEILFHAKSEYPRECCGLIVNVKGKEIYYPARNIAEKAIDFIMDPVDLARAEDLGDITAIVHSHCDISPEPSQADLVGCEHSNIPWVIVGIPMETWSEIKPKGYKADYVGREFFHGVLDCYSLIRDWYRDELGIELMDFDRQELWWEKGDDLYLDNFKKAGFFEVTDLKRGDLILMQVGSDTVNHAALYLGDGKILHHSMNRLSCREIYGGYWLKNTRKVIRHEGVL